MDTIPTKPAAEGGKLAQQAEAAADEVAREIEAAARKELEPPPRKRAPKIPPEQWADRGPVLRGPGFHRDGAQAVLPRKHAFVRNDAAGHGWVCPRVGCGAGEEDPVAVHERTDCRGLDAEQTP